MLKKDDIRYMTNSAFYLRGEELYAGGKVIRIFVEEADDGIWVIETKVRGSGRNVYDVHLVYNDRTDELEDSFCTCPAYYNYDCLCKHCVAALLAFAEETGHNAGMSAVKAKAGNGGGKEPLWIRQTETSTAMKELLDRRFLQRVFPMNHMEIYGQVHLEPTFTLRDGHASVQFRIGISQMYVIKDVLEFLDRMDAAEVYAYGKKLEFPHMKEAFAGDSRKMLEFILDWAVKNRAKYRAPRWYSYGNSPKVREMELNTEELERFLIATDGQPFRGQYGREGERDWRTVEGKQELTLTLEGKKDGIEVKAEEFHGYQGNRYVICFADGLVYLTDRKDVEPVRDFLFCMDQVPYRTAFIRKEDAPVFCSQLLPALERFFLSEKKDFDASEYMQQPASFEIYLDAPQKDFVTGKLFAVYGEEKYAVYGKRKETEGTGIRDLFREMEVGQAVASYFNAYDEEGAMMALSGDEEKLYGLMAEGIPKMQELGEVFVSEALKRFSVTQAAKVSMGISLAGDLLELTVSAGDMPMDQLVEILSKYDRKKKFYRLKNGSFVDLDGGDMGLLARLKDELGITDRQLRQERIALPKYRALYLDGELKEQRAFRAAKDRNFKELVRNMKTVEDNDFEIPASLEDIMREYQKKGFLWMKTLKHNGFGGILADDMGLGKTLQVIAFLLSEYIDAQPSENKRCLIVTPSSLVFNWSSEIERFAPALHVKTVTGTAAERREIIQESGERDILLTSYDLLKRDMDGYAGIRFYCQVIDEAQYIKNHNTQAAKAVKEIEAGFKLALTGTPMENRLSELWSIFDYLMPGFLYSYQHFRETIEIPAVQNGDGETMGKLRKMIGPFVLRRLKRDVLTDLPDKLEENMYAKLEGEQQKLYDAHVQRMRMMLDKTSEEEFRTSKIQILAELTKLRQICCDPALVFEGYEENSAKTDMCLDLVRNAVNGGHKMLVFSQFTSMLDRLEEALEREGIPCYMLTGATPKEKRVQMVEEFNKGDTQVFCISLKAGGTGLNLTSADIVIHYDPWWNLAVQNQATDRAHRIGQENVVNVYKLIVKGTIEDNIVKLQERKKELAEQVLGGDGVGSGSFTREELLELLGGMTK